MVEKKLNTECDFELADGQVVKLTLTFYKLLQLKNKDKKLYDRYNKITTEMQKNFEEVNIVICLYVAYVCANMGEDDLLTEDEFIMLCGSDRVAASEAYAQLTNPKKR